MTTNASPLVRQWQLIRTLSGRSATYEELARETGFDRRTIQRDVRLLRRVGFPIIEFTGEHGLKRLKIEDEPGLGTLRFTLEEAAALYLGRQFLEPLAGTLFHAGALNAYKKIRTTLGEAALRHLEKLAGSFYHTRQGWTDYTEKSNLIDNLSIAIEEHRFTVITYQSLRSTEPVSHYDVLPFTLIFHRSALYLIAHSNDHKEVRTFKVDRISDVNVTTLQFTRPTDFSPERFLESSFGIFEGQGDPLEIRVSFRPSVTRILHEKRFHTSQKLDPQRDGSTIATFHLSTLDEFLSWLLSFGPEAEVLSPPGVRNAMRTKLQQALSRYDNDHDQTTNPPEPSAIAKPNTNSRRKTPSIPSPPEPTKEATLTSRTTKPRTTRRPR